jgi:outer membrane protein assembly factor BamD
MIQQKILVFLLLFSLLSCSGYNKVLKKDNYEKKFELAGELYEKKQYMRSIALYEQIYQRLPKTSEGEVAYYRLGQSYYAEKDYYMAGYYFGSFYQRFSYSAKAEECLFLSAICSVNNSPDFTLDQNETELAINDLQQFINKFPNSVLVDSCNKVMDKMRFKLEKKDFFTLKGYSDRIEYKAAITTALTFLSDYPSSIFKEETYYILVKNSYLITKNSIEDKKTQRIEETLERYRKFVSEFPSTKYKKEVDEISDAMEREFQEITKK